MLRGRVGDALTRCICGGTTSFALLAGAPCVARADDECARVTAAPDLPPAWSSALHDLTEQLAALGSTHCHPLTLTLEPVDGEMRLVAVADDGRRAERRVARPSLLVPIALGLAISIPGEPPAGAPAPAPGGNAAPPPASAVRTLPASAPAAPAPAPSTVAAHSTEVWLGLALGGRFGVPSSVSMLDLEARADLRVDELLLFASFRNVSVGFVASEGFDADAYRESAISFGVGHTFSLGPCWLDIAAAPTIVTMRIGRDGPGHVRANDVELRIGVSARLSARLARTWRFTLTADTDLVPDALVSAVRVDPLPAFPAWTAGLRVGASGAVL